MNKVDERARHRANKRVLRSTPEGRARLRAIYRKWFYGEKGRAYYKRDLERKRIWRQTPEGKAHTRRASARQYARRKNDPEKLKRYKAYMAECQLRRRRRRKLAVLKGYGGKCQCCKIREPIFLTIDHIDGRGLKPRGPGRKVWHFSTTDEFYRWLIKNNFPKDDYRCLCFNCQIGVYRCGGKCPHQRKG